LKASVGDRGKKKMKAGSWTRLPISRRHPRGAYDFSSALLAPAARLQPTPDGARAIVVGGRVLLLSHPPPADTVKRAHPIRKAVPPQRRRVPADKSHQGRPRNAISIRTRAANNFVDTKSDSRIRLRRAQGKDLRASAGACCCCCGRVRQRRCANGRSISIIRNIHDPCQLDSKLGRGRRRRVRSFRSGSAGNEPMASKKSNVP
jgi:hypothetical protein